MLSLGDPDIKIHALFLQFPSIVKIHSTYIRQPNWAYERTVTNDSMSRKPPTVFPKDEASISSTLQLTAFNKEGTHDT